MRRTASWMLAALGAALVALSAWSLLSRRSMRSDPEPTSETHFSVGIRCLNCRRPFQAWFKKGTIIRDVDWQRECPHCGAGNIGRAR